MTDVSRKQNGQSQQPGLYDGKCMTQDEFHRCYDEMPDGYRAELIDGIVCEPSPLGLPHGTVDSRLSTLLDHYAMDTPGVEVAGNVTVILSDKDEVQPDVILRIKPGYGGQSQNVHLSSKRLDSQIPYVKGAPELVAEVAHSSRDIDLHKKKVRYNLAGVCEYVVVCLKPRKIFWFLLKENRELSANSEGNFCCESFPGLWIHGDALLQLDGQLSMSTLARGLASIEHEQFVLHLAASK